MHLQVKLLTVLQRRTIRRVGDESEIAVDVRVMAATNRDLTEDVREGRFREDLLFRLNVVTLTIPPLRERPEDIADLAGTIIRHFRTEQGLSDVTGVTEAAMEKLLAHDWPGNVRELANVIERAMLLCEGDRIDVTDLPAELGSPPRRPSLPGPAFRAPPRPPPSPSRPTPTSPCARPRSASPRPSSAPTSPPSSSAPAATSARPPAPPASTPAPSTTR